jgi:tetratricopeptide (TPR) repeat protein
MEPTAGTSYADLVAQGAAAYHELRLDEALQAYRRAAEQAPAAYEAHLGVARTLMRMRDREGALQAAERCLALDAERPEAYVVQGVVHFLADDLDEAEAALQRALALGPHEPEPLLTLAQVLCDRGELDEADRTLARARAEIEEIADADERDQLAALAWHVETYRHLTAGDDTAAYEAAQQVIALEAANPYAACLAYSNLGIMEAHRKNHAQAITYLERACEANPHFYRAAGALGRILLMNGQAKRAAEVLEQVVAHQDGDTAFGRYAYALALARTGRRKEAREQYGAALAQGLPGLSRWMARWQRLWLHDAVRYGIIGGALLAILLWVVLGNPSSQAITLAVMIVMLVLLQRVVGRRR